MSSQNAQIRGGDGSFGWVSETGDQSVETSFDQIITPVRIRLPATPNTPVQLENAPCSFVVITNLVDNDPLYVGGNAEQRPYIDRNYAGDFRGTIVYPGIGKKFPVTNANLLTVVGTPLQEFTYEAYPNVKGQVLTSQTGPPFIDTTPPTVTSVFPANGATSVATDTAIYGIFSEVIDPASISASSLTISPSVTASRFRDSVNTAKVVLDPAANLANSTTYTITLKGTGGSKITDTSGNPLAADFAWSFTTAAAPPPPDTTPPTVSSTDPASGATGVQVTTQITIIFSEKMLASSITTSTCQLLNNVFGAVSCSLALQADQKTVILTPNTSLSYSSTYYIQVKKGTTGVKDLAGNALVNTFQISFSTGVQSGGYTQIYNVSPSDVNDLWGSGDIYEGEIAKAGSTLINHTPRKCIWTMRRSGSPTGNITCEIINTSNGSILKQIGSAISASGLTTSDQQYTFEDAASSQSMQSGYALAIHFEGGNSSNFVRVGRNGSDSYNGSNSIRGKTSAGNEANWFEDSGREAAIIIYE